VEFLEVELEKDKKLKGAHLFVGQSKILKPHVFFQKHQFGPLPQQFEHLKLEGSDLAYRELKKSIEEEKEPAGRREKKINDKFNDGISDVSAVTNKTSKSRSGKSTDKHCLLCDFKFVKGSNWSRHCKDLHKGDNTQGRKCGIGCSCPKSK
jgi:hypothetical protein